MSKTKTRLIYCCACQSDIEARLTDGAEIYPHRPDLKRLPIWICDGCGNNIGCHHKTSNPTKPLGNIAHPELKKARSHIHRILDPIWQKKHIKRPRLYKMIADRLGTKGYHTADIRTVEEARIVYAIVLEIAQGINDARAD